MGLGVCRRWGFVLWWGLSYYQYSDRSTVSKPRNLFKHQKHIQEYGGYFKVKWTDLGNAGIDLIFFRELGMTKCLRLSFFFKYLVNSTIENKYTKC